MRISNCDRMAGQRAVVEKWRALTGKRRQDIAVGAAGSRQDASGLASMQAAQRSACDSRLAGDSRADRIHRSTSSTGAAFEAQYRQKPLQY
ncbi:MAG: hypothetical protein IPP88_20535 [Betaproteobacteria bacterium]|nr:hypothetical protein [Betaproteobacteria bacterium]